MDANPNLIAERSFGIFQPSLLHFRVGNLDYADCMECWIRVAYEAGASLPVGADARPSARGGLRLDKTVFGISYIHAHRGRYRVCNPRRRNHFVLSSQP